MRGSMEYHQDGRDRIVAIGGLITMAVGTVLLLLLVVCLATMAKCVYEMVYDVMVAIVGPIVLVNCL